MFGKHQRTAGRLLKSINPGQPTPPPETIAKLRKLRLSAIKERTRTNSDYESMEEFVSRIKRTPSPPGAVSAFLMGMEDTAEFSIPFTRRFSAEFDNLSQELIIQQWPGQGGSLASYKQILLDSPLVRREFWIEPFNNYDCRPRFEQAASWQDAWKLTNVIVSHLWISLLALWDAEYCADMFKPFTTIPLFLNLAPRRRPRPGEQQATGLLRLNGKTADVIDGPFSQLIDLLWCLLRYLQDDDWPSSFPTLGEMGEGLNCYQGDLAQLRAGKPNLTIDRLSALWPNTLRNKVGQPMSPPHTLLAAAHLWDLIDPPDRLGRPLLPVDRCYMHAWHRHRHALRASQVQARSPTIDWPGYLNRGLEIGAPK